MSNTLSEIAQNLKKNNKKFQLIYAFNGTGKTRLSREFKDLISPKSDENNDDLSELEQKEILYYSSFTEDLFYWDNDLEHDSNIKLKIYPNAFTRWVFIEQGLDQKVISNFQRYTNKKLTPNFNQTYTIQNEFGRDITIPAYSEVTFSFRRGDDTPQEHIKISKGEESNFVWSIFYSLLQQVIDELNIVEVGERSTDKFNNLKYIFIDDPVSSLDENHLIELAVDIAQLIKSSESELKFIITTHNPLFYNVLHNEFRNEKNSRYRLEKSESEDYILQSQTSDSPFAYQVHLRNQLEDLFKQELSKDELKNLIDIKDRKDKLDSLFTGQNEIETQKLEQLSKDFPEFNDLYVIKKHINKNLWEVKFYREKAIEDCQVEKYHFNFVRNILEKISTFLGYYEFKELLPQDSENNPELYVTRIHAYTNRKVNFGSHSKHSVEEMSFVHTNDKKVLKFLVKYLSEIDDENQKLNKIFRFKPRYIKFSHLNRG
ncbi:anticodon nuclease [Pasteurella multocida]